MKVVCIEYESSRNSNLIIGKIYNVVSIYGDYYFIENHVFFYHKNMFKLLSDIRNDKIDKLLGI